MPRYFYNLKFGDSQPDRVGVELNGPEQARAEAVRFLGELLTNEGEQLWFAGEIAVTVTDATGLILWTLAAHGSASPGDVGLPDRTWSGSDPG